jgi:hypothetical protein
LFVFWYHSPNVLDTLHICNISWLRVNGKIIIIIIITLYYIIFITFVPCIYSYIPETNHVSRVYSVQLFPYLQFVLHVTLLHMLAVLRAFTLVLSGESLQCPMVLFFNSFISCFIITFIIVKISRIIKVTTDKKS